MSKNQNKWKEIIHLSGSLCSIIALILTLFSLLIKEVNIQILIIIIIFVVLTMILYFSGKHKFAETIKVTERERLPSSLKKFWSAAKAGYVGGVLVILSLVYFWGPYPHALIYCGSVNNLGIRTAHDPGAYLLIFGPIGAAIGANFMYFVSDRYHLAKRRISKLCYFLIAFFLGGLIMTVTHYVGKTNFKEILLLSEILKRLNQLLIYYLHGGFATSLVISHTDFGKVTSLWKALQGSFWPSLLSGLIGFNLYFILVTYNLSDPQFGLTLALILSTFLYIFVILSFFFYALYSIEKKKKQGTSFNASPEKP